MPVFQNGKEGGHLLEQHREIHKGMDELEGYMKDCRDGKRELELVEMKKVLDGFGGVLWQHLNDEVENLGPEKMRRYWSLEEVGRLFM